MLFEDFCILTLVIIAFFMIVLPGFNKKNPIFKYAGSTPIEEFKKLIRDIRNGIQHCEYDDLAEYHKKIGRINNTDDYFKQGCFTQDMEIIYKTFLHVINQVDLTTGNIK